MASFSQQLVGIHGHFFSADLSQETIDYLRKNFPVRPDDTWIATYPKSGNTWMQQIVDLILNAGKDSKKIAETWVNILEYVPKHFKFDAKHTHAYYDSLQLAPSPRVFQTHYSYNTMPWGLPDATPYRCIYVARNPKDVVVSYYHHVKGRIYTSYSYKPSWDELFEFWLTTNIKVDGSSWFDHVLSFWAHKDDENILFLKYEDMKKDLPTAVAKIAKFMGCDLTQEMITDVAKQSEFKAMKDGPINDSLCSAGRWDPKGPPYIRKGVVGDWKNHFTPEQSAQLDAIYAERMKGTGLEFDCM